MRLLCQWLRLFCNVVSVTNPLPSKVEKDPYCQALIQQRQDEGLADKAPILADVSSCKLPPFQGILGGFPCQGVSGAGDGCRLADARSGLVTKVWDHWDEQEEEPILGYKSFLLNLISSYCTWIQRCLFKEIYSYCTRSLLENSPQPHTRLFALLENVGAILRATQRPLLLYLIKVPFQSLLNHTSSTTYLALKEAALRGLRISWVTITGKMVGAHAGVLLIFDVWNNIDMNSPDQNTEIWRERVFFLIAKPGFNMFQVNFNCQNMSKQSEKKTIFFEVTTKLFSIRCGQTSIRI